MKFILSFLALLAFAGQSFAQDTLLPGTIESPSGERLRFSSPQEQRQAIRQFTRDASQGTSSPVGDDLRPLIQQLKGTTDDANREKITAQLKVVLAKDYDEKMLVYENHLQKLEAQLTEMRQQLDRRIAAKDDMVNLRMQSILAEADNLGWPTGEIGGSSSRSYGNDNYGGMPGSKEISGSGSGGDYPLHDILRRRKILLKSLLLAMHHYFDYNQKLPFSNSSTDDLGWAVELLPYLAEIELFEQFDVDQPWHSKKNRSMAGTRPDALGGDSDYSFCWVSSEAKSFADITDGMARTIAIVVIPNRLLAEPMTWTEPGGLSVEQIQTLVQDLSDDEVFVVGTYDGSIYQLPAKAVKGRLFKGYLTINGGESVAFPFSPTSSISN